MNQDIVDAIIIKLFSEDLTEQEVFKSFLKKLKVDKNVFKFIYDEEISLTKLSNTVRLKLYHTLVRMILTNNPNIIINIGSMAAQQKDLVLMELCECYMEIHHMTQLDNYYINIFINLIRCPDLIYIKYIKFFSQFEWYYEQYDIFLIEILLRNRPYELKMPDIMSNKLSEIVMSITIKYNLFDLFVLYFNLYFKGIKYFTSHIINLCVVCDNLKIMKYVLKKIKFKGNYKNIPSNKTERFLKGILFKPAS